MENAASALKCLLAKPRPSAGGGLLIPVILSLASGCTSPAPRSPGALTVARRAEHRPEATESAAAPSDGVRAVAHEQRADTVTAGLAPSTESGTPYPIDLATAFRLAGAQNTQIALAQERLVEALAQLDQAQVLLLPTLSAGASYQKHDGRIQETSGRVIEASRNSGYAGLGAGAVGAGAVPVPGASVRVDMADAIFQPLVARQNLRLREASSRVVQDRVLLDVATAYLDLVRAKGDLAIAEESLRHATELARVTENYANTGEGLQSDAERAAVERLLREKDIERARETLRVRSAQLAELLRLDPQTDLDPLDEHVVPLEVVSGDPPLGELVATALESRPELEESRALVDLTIERLRQAKYGPLLPSILLGASVGAFGGGNGSTLGNGSDRTDFDAMVVWELRNLGLGDHALRDERESQLRQAQTVQIAVLDRVASEVTQAHASVVSRRKQLAPIESAVQRALRSFELNRTRIFEKQGLPIEVLQAIQSLAAARREYLNAVIEYNAAQFRLFTAIGQPASAAPTKPGIPVKTPVVPNK